MRQNYWATYTKIPLPFRLKKAVLAVGTQTKNTLCFAEGNTAYLSPLHPDLNQLQDFLAFKKSLDYLLKRKPRIIVADLHPEYQATKYIQGLRWKAGSLGFVQHHHAHIVSCMVDCGLKNQQVIGVVFDGTGWGADDTLWGAEFLLADYKNFQRLAHLKEVYLLGAERAILEPWRLAAFWLYLIYQDNFWDLKIKLLKVIKKKQWQVLKKMYFAGLNAPISSSMGRLFDAVASLVLEKSRVSLEAELAMELERKAKGFKSFVLPYNFGLLKQDNQYIIDPCPLFKEIIQELEKKEAGEKIAYRFHLTVAEMLCKTCLLLRKKTKINKVVLSGGVFQNNVLRPLSLDLLSRKGFRVFTHRNFSCNDSAVSLGQAVIASLRS